MLAVSKLIDLHAADRSPVDPEHPSYVIPVTNDVDL